MISLEHQRAESLFVVERRRSRRTGHFTILVYYNTVVNDLDELGVLGFLTVLVEPCGPERDVECLPRPRFP